MVVRKPADNKRWPSILPRYWKIMISMYSWKISGIKTQITWSGAWLCIFPETWFSYQYFLNDTSPLPLTQWCCKGQVMVHADHLILKQLVESRSPVSGLAFSQSWNILLVALGQSCTSRFFTFVSLIIDIRISWINVVAAAKIWLLVLHAWCKGHIHTKTSLSRVIPGGNFQLPFKNRSASQESHWISVSLWCPWSLSPHSLNGSYMQRQFLNKSSFHNVSPTWFFPKILRFGLVFQIPCEEAFEPSNTSWKRPYWIQTPTHKVFS